MNEKKTNLEQLTKKDWALFRAIELISVITLTDPYDEDQFLKLVSYMENNYSWDLLCQMEEMMDEEWNDSRKVFE